MCSYVKQDNDFTIGFRILFNREDNTTIIAARTGLKTVEFTAQLMSTQVWTKYICFHLLKSIFNTLLNVSVSLHFPCGMLV